MSQGLWGVNEVRWREIPYHSPIFGNLIRFVADGRYNPFGDLNLSECLSGGLGPLRSRAHAVALAFEPGPFPKQGAVDRGQQITEALHLPTVRGQFLFERSVLRAWHRAQPLASPHQFREQRAHLLWSGWARQCSAPRRGRKKGIQQQAEPHIRSVQVVSKLVAGGRRHLGIPI